MFGARSRADLVARVLVSGMLDGTTWPPARRALSPVRTRRRVAQVGQPTRLSRRKRVPTSRSAAARVRLLPVGLALCRSLLIRLPSSAELLRDNGYLPRGGRPAFGRISKLRGMGPDRRDLSGRTPGVRHTVSAAGPRG
jgi:hypothetical protein